MTPGWDWSMTWTNLLQLNFIKLTHLEELQGLQDSLLWSYLFMSLLLLLTHYFLRFALSFSRSRRGLAGLERGNWGWQKPEGRGRSEGVITIRRYWYWCWVGKGEIRRTKQEREKSFWYTQEVGERGENCVYFTDEEALVLVLRGGGCVSIHKRGRWGRWHSSCKRGKGACRLPY